MAIKIVKHGQPPQLKLHSAKCGYCGCEFTYQEEDVQADQRERGRWVTCPEQGCKHAVIHK